MPLRIALVASLTIAACMVVPLSVNAVSTPGSEEVVDADDPGPSSDSVPIAEPAYVDNARDREATIDTAGDTAERSSPLPYGVSMMPDTISTPSLSGVGLAAAVLAGFLPACFVMARSSRRRRAGPLRGMSSFGGPEGEGDRLDRQLRDSAGSGAFGAS